MAGSYGHVVNDKGQFRGVDLIENDGDVYEAVEEMYGMIWLLAGGDAGLVEDARRRYQEGIDLSPGVADE